ncbi:MAG TPA: Spy/CpxP family protein refolding chaperone [Acidobacteriota bacterium]
MKRKLLWLAIPVGVVAIVFGAHAAQSYGGFHGGFHHRGAMAKDFLEYRLDKLSKELNLNDEQKAKLDTFKQDMETAMDQRRETHDQIHQILKDELSKDNPDFDKIRPMIDQQIDAVAQSAHDFVGRVGDFYKDLTPEQKKILKDHIMERMGGHDRGEDID